MAKCLAFLSGAAEHADRADLRARYDGVLKRTSLGEMWTPQIRAVVFMHEKRDAGSGS